jgi:hypothetical protein
MLRGALTELAAREDVDAPSCDSIAPLLTETERRALALIERGGEGSPCSADRRAAHRGASSRVCRSSPRR